MWRGQIWFSTAMLMAIGFLVDLPHRRPHRHLPRQPAARLLHPRHVLRRRPLPLGGHGAGLRRHGAASTTGAPRSPATCSNERIGKAQFWFLFIGTNVFTLPQYLLGLDGMPRRIAVYPHDPQWQKLNDWSSAGAALIGISHAAVRGQRRLQLEEVPGRRQPVGRPDPRVVHHLAAAAPQLLPAAPDPLRAADVGLQPPRRTAPSRTASTTRAALHEVPRPVRIEAKLLLGLGLFFGVMCAVYWNWSLENAGGVMMFAGMLLGFLPGGYYYWWSRRMRAAPRGRPAGDAGLGRRRRRRVPRHARSGRSRWAWARSSACWHSSSGSGSWCPASASSSGRSSARPPRGVAAASTSPRPPRA